MKFSMVEKNNKSSNKIKSNRFSFLIYIFGLALMISRKREILLQLTEVKYHGRIGTQVNQMVVLVRMRLNLLIVVVTVGVGMTYQ